MQSTSTLIAITLLSTIASLGLCSPVPSYITSGDDGGNGGDGGDGGGDGDGGLTTTIPNNQCGYTLELYTAPEYTFASNDTVWFYEPSLPSNCVAPNSDDLPCRGDMIFTGDFGASSAASGYKPYSVWYDFSDFGTTDQSEWVYTLRFNYDEGQTSIVATFPCDGIEYDSELSKCMFNEELYTADFYKYYRFTFFTTCTYDATASTIAFNVDQQSETCVGLGGEVNTNKFTLASFTDWSPLESTIVSDDPEFCPDCTTPTTTTDVPESTTTPCETTTTAPAITEAPGKCKSCQNINVNVNVNTNVSTNVN